jgi:hypothetical protein
LSSVWHVFPLSVAFFIISLVILQFLPRFERLSDDPKIVTERIQ